MAKISASHTTPASSPRRLNCPRRRLVPTFLLMVAGSIYAMVLFLPFLARPLAAKRFHHGRRQNPGVCWQYAASVVQQDVGANRGGGRALGGGRGHADRPGRLPAA